MSCDFHQITWDETVADDCRQIIRLAVREDLDRSFDLTTVALVPPDAEGATAVVARSIGVIAGLPAAALVLHEMDTRTRFDPKAADGDCVIAGQTVAEIRGSTRDILTCERILLNLLGRLSGIATLTRAFVDAVAGHKASIYDTRKTTPAWRRLEKYAVRCGGGRNHRTGLFDAVLIKDNHLASGITPAGAVRRVRRFLAEHHRDANADVDPATPIVEVEVDSLDQLAEVLGERPDLVLLDNMSLDTLRHAVAMRDRDARQVQLEASGGVTLDTVAQIAATGVDRISVGALTHAATSLDFGLDWVGGANHDQRQC